MGKMDYELKGAGSHDHHPALNKTMMGGGHSHILGDLKTLIREGEHTHTIGEGIITEKGGAHVHEVTTSDGKKFQMEIPDGDHTHEVLPEGNAYETGQHVHTVKMPGGVEFKTLGPSEIRMEIQKNIGTPGFWGGLINGPKE